MNIFTKLSVSFIFAIITINSSYAIDGQSMFKEVNTRIKVIDSVNLKKMIDDKAEFVLLDVRMPTEIKRMGSIDAAQNKEIPRGWLELRITNLVKDKNTPIVTYCGGGFRSAFAADTLTQMGYTNVKNYRDGFLGWEDKGFPAKYQ
ncbi:MAG: rhodanese-like domain-containing protein [Pseudomonadota bacterium]